MSLTFTPRSTWGAGSNGRADRGALNLSGLVGITVHWPGGGSGLTRLSTAQVAAQLRTWQAQHRRQQWGDIGYNFLGDGSGNVWEGCGLYRGAHTGVMRGNVTTVGYQMITGTDEGPTAKQVAAFLNFRAELLKINPRATAIYCHSDWTSTSCPGDPIRDLIRRGALASAAAGNATEGDDMFNQDDRDALADVRRMLGAGDARKVIDETEGQKTLGYDIRVIRAVVEGIAVALKGVPGVDPTVIEDAVERGMRDALASIEATVTVKKEK